MMAEQPVHLQPRWWIGVAVYLAYAAWVVATWAFLGVDYASIGTERNLLQAVVFPLGVAAILLSCFNGLAGWWPSTMREPRLRRPVYLFWLLLPIAGFIGLNLHATDWVAIGPVHVLLLLAAMLLVGFCEEMVTRGILLVALRGSIRSEAWVWFCSSALFGLMHGTNAFFGLGYAALIQVALAFCAGTGLYLVRRLTGSLWVAMGVHALWDFSSLGAGLGPGKENPGAFVFVVAIYVVSLALLTLVMRQKREPA